MVKTSILAAAVLLLAAGAASAQTVVPLEHPAPDGALLTFQLTDGTVLAQGNNLVDWWKLTPDINGSYVDGVWTRMANLPEGYAPDAFASAVLADGRLVIAGGEYNEGNFALTDRCAWYDPAANTWTKLKAPKGWAFIGDSPSVVLPDGRFLLGRKLDKRIAALDPATMTWTELASTGKRDFNAEEGWTLLPNGTVLTYDVKAATNSEIYDPATQSWTSAGSTIRNLRSPPDEASIGFGNGHVYHPPGEVGPGILRPDGTVFATGATYKGGKFGHTSVYHPPADGTGIGTWKPGPDFPDGMDAGDSFAVLLPTGDVLVEAEAGQLLIFDGASLKRTPYNGSSSSLMVLPTGEVLVDGNRVFRAVGTVHSAWAPSIESVAATLVRGTTYPISGRQFNGLSQAAAFGDEYQTATNYPLVRITNAATGHVFYAHTHDHSTMGVATGKALVSTKFELPTAAETGAATLVVVANGIPSKPVSVTVK